MKNIIILLFVLFGGSIFYGQEQKISGHITSATDKTPLLGVPYASKTLQEALLPMNKEISLSKQPLERYWYSPLLDLEALNTLLHRLIFPLSLN